LTVTFLFFSIFCIQEIFYSTIVVSFRIPFVFWNYLDYLSCQEWCLPHSGNSKRRIWSERICNRSWKLCRKLAFSLLLFNTHCLQIEGMVKCCFSIVLEWERECNRDKKWRWKWGMIKCFSKWKRANLLFERNRKEKTPVQ
jgi:hypothetical protein